MNKKSLVMILILSLSLVFAGCSGGADGAKEDSLFGGKSGSTSKGGSGVELSFADGRPSSEMFKGEPVTFAFVFTNYQEHEINDMKLETRGFDKGYVSGLSESYNINKIPQATINGAGIYPGHIVNGVSVDNFEDNYNFNPTFDYCYTAKTSFREQVCVPSKTNECDISFDKSSNQNGPLNVKIDRIRTVDKKVRVDLTINNNGKGQVVNECFNVEDYANKYKYKVSLGSQTGNCEAVSDFTIINGKSNFYCEFNSDSDSEYSSQVVVELDYNYQQSTEKKIVVKDLNYGYE